jgi:hypothetical protein
MRLLVFLYFVFSVVVSGSMIFRGMVWGGIALLIGSIIGFAAGSGARGGIYMGQRKSALTIGIVLLIVGMGLVFYTGVNVSMFGIEFGGDVWVMLGAVIGWFAAKPADAGVRDQPKLDSTSGTTLLNDQDWNGVGGEFCKVLEFTPTARIENGEVIAVPNYPYASVTLVCEKLPHDSLGFICHRTDFKHLWTAFIERGVGDDEEVIIVWLKYRYKGLKRVSSAILPGLHVGVYKRGSYDVLNDPESTTAQQLEAAEEIEKWIPELLES